jgi:DNA polymerase-3 subunit alpha
MQERTAHGPFVSLEDFLLRMRGNDVNKKSLEALIKSGALNALGEKAQLLYNIQELLQFSPRHTVNTAQLSLFSGAHVAPAKPHLPLKQAPAASRLERMQWEKEVLGLYLSEHPFSEYTAMVQGHRTPLKVLKQERTQGVTIIAGIVTAMKKIFTKKGEPMVFARVEDESDHIEAVVFPKFLEHHSELFKEGNPIRLKGRTDISEEGIKFFPEQGELLVKP